MSTSEELFALHAAKLEESKKAHEKRDRFADYVFRKHADDPASVSKCEWARYHRLKKEAQELRLLAESLGRLAHQKQSDEFDQEIQERHDTIKAKLDEGKSVKEIAEEVGVSTSTVYKYRRRIKEEAEREAEAKRPRTEEELAEIARGQKRNEELQQQWLAEIRERQAASSGCALFVAFSVALPVVAIAAQVFLRA